MTAWLCVLKKQQIWTSSAAASLEIHWQCLHGEMSFELPQSLEWSGLTFSRATQIRCHVCTPGHQLHGTKPDEELDQPSFPAHSVELSPLCDEIGWRFHLNNVASVHDDHSVKQQGKKKTGFRPSNFYFT